MTSGYIDKYIAGGPVGLRLEVSESKRVQKLRIGSHDFTVKHGKNNDDDITVKIDNQKLVHIPQGSRRTFDGGGMFNVDIIHS